jgi:hypothetical protein
MSEEPGRDGLGRPHPAPWPPTVHDPAAQSGGTSTAVPPPWAAPGGSPEPATGPAAGTVVAAPAQPPGPLRSPDQLGQVSRGVPLRPLSVGEILGGAAGIFRRNPRSVLPVSALLVTLQQLLVVAAQLLTREVPTRIDLASGGAQLSLAGGLGAVVGLFLSSIVGAVLTGMIVVLVAEDALGHRLGVGDVWRRVRPRLAALIGVSLVVGVLSVLGLFLLLVPGAILWSAWALTTPVLLLERSGPIQALRRSWQLAWPDILRVFSIRLVAFLLGLFILYVIAAPFLLIGALIADPGSASGDDQAPLVALAFAVVGSIVGGIIARPFGAGVLALLYVDRRMRAEGLDVALELQLRQRRRPPPATAGQPGRGDLPALSDGGPGRWSEPVPVPGVPSPAAGMP